jgi:uncharacterized RDD family membrane protein YckC
MTDGWIYRLHIEGRSIDLAPGRTIVGRGRSATVRLGHESVSRQHAAIVCEEGRATLEDVGSSNGTFLGERRVSEPARLLHGAVIRFGSVRGSFELGPAGEAAERTACPRCGGPLEGEGVPCPACDAGAPVDRPDGAADETSKFPSDGAGRAIANPGPPAEAPAGKEARLAAASVDFAVVGGISFFLIAPAIGLRFVHGALQGAEAEGGGGWVASGLAGAGLLFAFLFFAGSWARRGATWGERLCGLRVRATGGTTGGIGWQRAVSRTILFAVSILVVGLGLVPILFGRRGFHDVASGTRVVRTPEGAAS